MNLFKFSTLSAFVFFLLVFSTPALALDTQAKGAVPVGTVSLEDARIISQKGSIFDIAFTISNRDIIQTGVKYGIQLVPEGTKYYAVDERVYDESLTLNENVSLKRQIIYTAPSYISGSYNLLLVSSNESNFPFGIVSLGKVKLIASTKGIQIMNESCYTQVEGEKGSPKYSVISQSVDISNTEVLKLTCTAINNTSAIVSAIPTFETREYSAYGKVATQTGGDTKPITFAKNEKKTFSVVLPKSDKPGFYYIDMGLISSNALSNHLPVKYIIRGVNATLQKVSLDRDYYKARESGELSVLWSASAGNFQRSGIKYAVTPKVILKATITNNKGNECVNPITQTLTKVKDVPETKIAFDVKTSCVNPKVSATITDTDGNILDQKEFTFMTTSIDTESKPLSRNSVAFIILGLLVVAGLGIYMKKKQG